MQQRTKKMKDKRKMLFAFSFLTAAGSFFFSSADALCKQQPDLGVYKIVVTRDPFDPERGKNWDEAYSMDAISADEFKKRYQLYGTVLSETLNLAYIKSGEKDKNPLRKEEKEHIKNIVVGDIIDGWRVKEIADKGVVFTSGKDIVSLMMYEGEKPERKALSSVAEETQPKELPQAIKKDERQPPQAPSSPPATPFQPMARSGREENGKEGFRLMTPEGSFDIDELRKRKSGDMQEAVSKRLERLKNR
jgi:hypothetical protein